MRTLMFMLLLILGACGQTGDLYLPDPEPPQTIVANSDGENPALSQTEKAKTQTPSKATFETELTSQSRSSQPE